MSVVFEGLAELREALRALPRDLAGEAGHIVEATTNAAEYAIKSAYGVATGNLRDHVTSTFSRSEFGAVGEVRNTAKHAWMYENGTQARHTELGANRGAMPPAHAFVPAAIRERRRMYADLKDMVARHPLGLEVSGDA